MYIIYDSYIFIYTYLYIFLCFPACFQTSSSSVLKVQISSDSDLHLWRSLERQNLKTLPVCSKSPDLSPDLQALGFRWLQASEFTQTPSRSVEASKQQLSTALFPCAPHLLCQTCGRHGSGNPWWLTRWPESHAVSRQVLHGPGLMASKVRLHVGPKSYLIIYSLYEYLRIMILIS